MIIGDIHQFIGHCLIPVDPWSEMHREIDPVSADPADASWQLPGRHSLNNGYTIRGYCDRGMLGGI